MSYYVPGSENISISSSLLSVINEHPKKLHPNDPTDKLNPSNVSLTTLKQKAKKNLFNPSEFNNPSTSQIKNLSVLSFSNTSLMSAEVYIKRATNSDTANGDIYIRPRFGSGKYILSWWRSTADINSAIGTISIVGPWLNQPGTGILPPISKINNNENLFEFRPQVKNSGTANWSGFKMEILNLNEISNVPPQSDLKNYLSSTCVFQGNKTLCTNNTGKYTDPVTQDNYITINDWTPNVGSLTGNVSYFNSPIKKNDIKYLKQVFRLNSYTNPSAPSVVQGYIKDAFRYQLLYKITPYIINPTGIDPNYPSEIRYLPDSNYFEEGVVISTATNNKIDNGNGVVINANTNPIDIITRIKSLAPITNGYLGVADGPNIIFTTDDKIITFKLTDFITGQTIYFIARTGVKTDTSTGTGGFCQYVKSPPNSQNQYVGVGNKQYFKPNTGTETGTVPPQILLNYPGDDGVYNYLTNPPDFYSNW